eukprot:3132108-Amphidinium_carterae.1
MDQFPEHDSVNGFPRPVPAPEDPQFADFVHHILTTGRAPAHDNTMETDDEPQVNNADGNAAAQSISSN